ncbi:hypothetical protein DPEC_G00166420 [Dallia pectoralis]|uniref:Uncharacterized protein n=1 Tax=Dallia pectoralis TaxID=75939 RepID=A0ACC2GHS1_DALPE|nr:hypothetical protein DPEC_G00166420 [Dallia pectoralis]
MGSEPPDMAALVNGCSMDRREPDKLERKTVGSRRGLKKGKRRESLKGRGQWMMPHNTGALSTSFHSIPAASSPECPNPFSSASSSLGESDCWLSVL